MPDSALRLPVWGGPDFDGELDRRGLLRLVRAPLDTLQVNVGRVCNQACHHCHVEAGPKRTEQMSGEVADRVQVLMANPRVRTVDITGGAPELNPHFRRTVIHARSLGKRVIDRCNLTILFEDGMEDLGEFFAANQVEVTASLPCYSTENVDAQRGHGVFDKSIRALQILGELGYGRPDTGLVLNLVYNPLGPSLPPDQAGLEADYKRELGERFAIGFNQLFTITNMPIKRFADQLQRRGQHEAYMGLLVNHFNDAAALAVMCRSLISVGYDGKLYDCDFNQMLELPIGAAAKTVFDLGVDEMLEGAPIATGSHCFGCTAGSGSSCGGALSEAG